MSAVGANRTFFYRKGTEREGDEQGMPLVGLFKKGRNHSPDSQLEGKAGEGRMKRGGE